MESYINLERSVIAAVFEAAKIVKSRDFTAESKSTKDDIVTSSDLLVQEFLCNRLSALLPDSGFLCEENDLAVTDREYVWIIDPIDGTTNYARDIPDCAISVALLRSGAPVVGVVYAPFHDMLFAATAGGGATLNGRRIAVSDKPFSSSLLCTAMSLYRKELAAVCRDVIFDAYGKCGDFRRFGSCAVELCYLAAGKCDLYFEIRIFPWDYAASYLILVEAGGILTGLNGEKPTFDKPTVLIGANNAENHAELCKIVSAHIKSTPYDEKL